MHKGTVLITGGTSGLGFELVKYFLQAGYEVYATGRDQARLISLGERVQFVKVDFSDLADVNRGINSILKRGIRFNIVINNAGVLSPPEFTPTTNGIEYSFQVNFLAHLLIDELITGEENNVDPLTFCSITSPVYKLARLDFKVPGMNNYQSFKTYSESKLYLLLIGDYLMNKYQGKDLKFIGFDPGTFSSGIYRMQNKWFRMLYMIAAPFMRSPVKVAATLGEILVGMDFKHSLIYRRRNSFSVMKKVDNEKVIGFMSKCSGLIRSYLR